MNGMTITTTWQEETREVAAAVDVYDCMGKRVAKLTINSGGNSIAIVMLNIADLNDIGDKIAAAIEWATEEEDERAERAGEVVMQRPA